MKLKHFKTARRLSKKSVYCFKLGAVVVKNNSEIGWGWNIPHKTNPKSRNPFKTTHAELHSIIGLSSEDLQGATIYVYREHKNGNLACAKPCIYCYEMLKLAGVKKICYSDYNGYKEEKIL